MLHHFLVAAFAMTALMGCERGVDLHPASDAPTDSYVDDGVTIATGESIHLTINEEHRGFETQGAACDEFPSLTASDPSIVAIRPWNGEYVDVNAYRTYAYGFVVIGLRAGDVVLTGDCSGLEATLHLTVRP